MERSGTYGRVACRPQIPSAIPVGWLGAGRGLYIFEKFGKIKSEGTRGGKIRENRNADAKGAPAPHRIREWNTQNSKAASAPAADALNDV
jgi:hypothetical protein